MENTAADGWYYFRRTGLEHKGFRLDFSYQIVDAGSGTRSVEVRPRRQVAANLLPGEAFRNRSSRAAAHTVGSPGA